jgi:hypothetical protein
MLRAQLLLSGFFLFAALAEGWKISGPLGSWTPASARRLLSVAAACTLTTFSPVLTPPPAFAANAAIEAATKAMYEVKDKGEAADRPFEKLPAGAKKRQALQMCKDADKRQSAEYRTVEACGAAVMSGNYAIAFPNCK